MASSSFFPPEKTGTIIIFSRISDRSAELLLRDNIEDRLAENIQGANFAWLITENEPGKLKIHYGTFGQVRAEIKYEYGTLDLVHTANGWRLIQPLENPTVQVSTENIDKDNQSLMQELNKIPSLQLQPRVHSILQPLLSFQNFQQANLIIPTGEKISKNYAYQWQETTTPKSFLCAGTGVILKDPVTVISPKSSAEQRGKTYEKDYLLSRGYGAYPKTGTGVFVSNIILRDIIQAVTNSKPADNLVLDPLLYVEMQEAVLTPSGHSYSDSSIRKWLETSTKEPQTKLNITDKDLTPNLALRDFIQQDLPKLQSVTPNKAPGRKT